MSAGKPAIGPLEVGYYSTTDLFRGIDQHAAVMRADRSLVAVTGPSTGKGAMDALDCAHLFSAAPDLLAALEGLLSGIERGQLASAEIAARAAIAKARGES